MKSIVHLYAPALMAGTLTLLTGCSQLNVTHEQSSVSNTVSEHAVQHEQIEIPDEQVAIQYYEEEAHLAHILQFYEEAMTAYHDGDFGLAETKIDSASVLSSEINIESIEDDTLRSRFQSTLSNLFQSYGQILNETARIVQEDPSAWLDELVETDPEQFKNGQWTDDELRRIVTKVSLISDVPLDYNENVRNSIQFFQTRGRDVISKWLRRSGKYMPLLRQILEEEGVPQDLVYLSMIESGFSPVAYSRASAVGLWQFIYSTGRLYGLERTAWVDERRDPVKSTRAAAKHLKDLYKMYGDWQLVMAAYNSGPRRVNRQINSEEDIEFWEMSLPRETRNYVPSYIAATVIAKAPELFGFDNIEPEQPFDYDEVEVHPYTSLAVAAKCAGTTVDEIKALNAELRTNNAPPGEGNYALRIPKGTSETFIAAYENLPVEEYQPPRVSTYYVKRGDTLSHISQRFSVSVTQLMAANNISNPRSLRIGQRLNIPGKAGVASSSTPRVVNVDRTNTTKYTVRKNDSLWLISQRHNTTVNVLQALNNMGNGSRIVPGQVILVPGQLTSTISATQPELSIASNTQNEVTYIIQKNDTLYEIAKQYGVTYQQIMQWNKIKNHRTIKPGQRIIIKPKS